MDTVGNKAAARDIAMIKVTFGNELGSNTRVRFCF